MPSGLVQDVASSFVKYHAIACFNEFAYREQGALHIFWNLNENQEEYIYATKKKNRRETEQK